MCRGFSFEDAADGVAAGRVSTGLSIQEVVVRVANGVDAGNLVVEEVAEGVDVLFFCCTDKDGVGGVFRVIRVF